jgi:hypothetical protein
LERTKRWPVLPGWALIIVLAYSSLVGLATWIDRTRPDATLTFCMFRRVTHYPCPGCGTTRMFLAAAQGRWGEAAVYNPLAFGLIILGLGLLAVRVIWRRRVVWITSAFSRRLWTALLVLGVLANWLYLLVFL